MRYPVILKKKNGKRIAICATTIDRVIDEDGLPLRQVIVKKGTSYGVVNTFDEIMGQINAFIQKPKKDDKDK